MFSPLDVYAMVGSVLLVVLTVAILIYRGYGFDEGDN